MACKRKMVTTTSPSTPRYLSDDCQLVSDVGRRRLRSSDVSTCVVPRTHTGFGYRAFQVAGPRLWNSLPASLRGHMKISRRNAITML